MSDIAIMAAIVQSKFPSAPSTSQEAAKALYAAGFRLQASDVDQQQNAAIARLEKAITRLEGWSGLP